MKFKKIFCNTNILILFFRSKLATETMEIGEPSRNINYNLSNVDKVKNIEALYFKCVEERGLKRVFFSTMLKVLDLMTHVEESVWIEHTLECCLDYIKKYPREKRRYIKKFSGMFKLLEYLKTHLFTDHPDQKRIFEKSPLFDFRNKCYRCDNCNELNAEKDFDFIHECRHCKKTYEYYYLTDDQTILHRNYYSFFIFVDKKLLKNFNLKDDEWEALSTIFGMTSKNTKYSFLKVILIKCFEIVDRSIKKNEMLNI